MKMVQTPSPLVSPKFKALRRTLREIFIDGELYNAALSLSERQIGMLCEMLNSYLAQCTPSEAAEVTSRFNHSTSRSRDDSLTFVSSQVTCTKCENSYLDIVTTEYGLPIIVDFFVANE